MRATAPGQSALLLLDAVSVLRDQGVAYVVVGAMAGAVHGVVRASIDADAVLSIAASEAQRVRDAFVAAGFGADLRRGDPDDPIAALLQLQDHFGNRVDLLIGLRGFESATFSRASDVPFEGEVLKVVRREDFIAMKLFAGGPQDILDATQAYEVDPHGIDVELLKRVTSRYGKDAARQLEALIAR